MQEIYLAESEADLPRIAEDLLGKLQNKIVLLEGEMGAGKTTLIKALCRAMKIEDPTGSPTFALVNEYLSPSHGAVFHFDFYRVESEEEALDMGLDDYLYSGNYCFVEWPEKIRTFLPGEYDEVHIKVINGVRSIRLKTKQNE